MHRLDVSVLLSCTASGVLMFMSFSEAMRLHHIASFFPKCCRSENDPGCPLMTAQFLLPYKQQPTFACAVMPDSRLR